MITTVLLDVDNTLLDFNLCAKESMHLAAEKFGIALPENIFEIFHEINTGLWHDIEKGKLTREGLYKIRWKTIFEVIGVDFDGEAFEAQFVENLHSAAIPVDGAIDLLEYLCPKYMLCVASNAAYGQQVSRLTRADMLKYMKHLFISEQIGAPKPSPEFFDKCIEALGVGTDELIMIGDSISADINGAHNYGIRTCFYNHAKADLPSDLCADYTVNYLSEIKNIL